MNTYLIKGQYSNGSWSRMLAVTDDRTSAVRELMESLGGSLERMYFDVEVGASWAIADLPDSVTVAAVTTAVRKTGSFITVEVHELLSEEQLHQALVLAKDVSKIYRAPGSAAIDRDSVSG